MNLVVDQGNTVCKVAVCDKDRVIKSYALPKLSLREAVRIIDRHPGLSGSIYSSVGGFDRYLLRVLRDRIPNTIYLDDTISVPISVKYNRRELGADRLAAVVAAHKLAPKGREVLVVDSGTAITFERISSDGLYLGGNISPGLSTRLKSLHHFTSRLPLLSYSDVNVDIGTCTKEAILKGVLKGLCYEIDGYINELRRIYPDVVVILAGGDSILFQKELMNQVYVMRNLVVLGLNLILEYNKNKNKYE